MTRINRCVGLELEFSSSRINLEMSNLNRILNDFARTHNYRVTSDERSDTWTLKTDHCGYELTSPVFNATAVNFLKVKSIIDKLKEICHLNRTNNLPAHQNVCSPACGMHVHVDVNDLNSNQMKNLINIFRTYEDALLSIQAPSRRDNGFVILLQERFRNIPQFNNNSSINDIIHNLTDHYCAVNFGSYTERGSMEVRYGSATVTGQKAINWIQLLVLLTEIAKRAEDIQYQSNRTVNHLKEFITNNETDTWIDTRRSNLSRWIDRRVEQITSYHTAMEERREQNRNRNEHN